MSIDVAIFTILFYAGLFSFACAIFKAIVLNPVIDIIKEIRDELKKQNDEKPENEKA